MAKETHRAILSVIKHLPARAGGLLRCYADMKPFAASFYKSPAWQACRASYLKARPLCEDCLARGIYTPAEIVHHVQPITPDNINDPSITLAFGNLRSVCRECHAKEHGARVKRYKLDELGRVSTKE
ncbi:MAG: HNH endonuclease [Ruminococcus sp.]|nr:HNH endonuclease [Ruminococcus sp.]